MDVAISLLVTLLLTLANGYFSGSEMALVNARRALLEPEADEGDRKARKALDLAADSSQFLATIQVAITLVGFASSAFAATSLSAPLADAMVALSLSPAIAQVVAPVLITLAVSYLSIVVGELLPKRIALADAEKVAKAVAGPIAAFMALARPLVWLTSASANALARLFGISSVDDRQNISEDELRYMVTDADELSDQEKNMIHEVIDLGDTIAREVMVPRVDMCAVEDLDSLRDVLALMRQTGHSRIPVYHESVDRIVGIAHIKDLIAPLLDEHKEEAKVAAYVRRASFVPDTKDIMPLLSEMQLKHEQMVIVVDEYGGTAGLITIEDIVEEVVGEIEDEFDPDNKYITQISENEWLVDGRFSLDDAQDLGWPIEQTEEYETIAGFVADLADKLPRRGDVVTLNGWEFQVCSTRGRRLSMLRVIAPTAELMPPVLMSGARAGAGHADPIGDAGELVAQRREEGQQTQES